MEKMSDLKRDRPSLPPVGNSAVDEHVRGLTRRFVQHSMNNKLDHRFSRILSFSLYMNKMEFSITPSVGSYLSLSTLSKALFTRTISNNLNAAFNQRHPVFFDAVIGEMISKNNKYLDTLKVPRVSVFQTLPSPLAVPQRGYEIACTARNIWPVFLRLGYPQRYHSPECI
jgi:hypothetical protein